MENLKITEGILTVKVTGSKTSIFLSKQSDYIPTHAGRMGLFNMVYMEKCNSVVYVEF
jgi:hypothetical protein